ncbi:MAG: hypothetical protein N2645_12705 [Clostridia bacterium]|nr:hypothetical protein [Clostridia bacterium]
MSLDRVILITAWILAIIMLILFIPKNKLREAYVIFFFKQLMTWITGLTVAQFGLIEYPVREFAYATRTSFTFEFFIYPAICVVFNLHYPEEKTPIGQFIYYFYFCTAMTIIELLCEKYTNIIKYIHWSWYVTWITLFLTFYFSRKYYVWFFKLKDKSKVTGIKA